MAESRVTCEPGPVASENRPAAPFLKGIEMAEDPDMTIVDLAQTLRSEIEGLKSRVRALIDHPAIWWDAPRPALRWRHKEMVDSISLASRRLGDANARLEELMHAASEQIKSNLVYDAQ